MARILILGGGFAAISAAQALAASAGSEHEIMLVSKSSDFTFFPAIIPTVFGDIEPQEIRFDLRPALVERGIHFVQGDVRAINTSALTVKVAGDRIDSTIGYDYLILAMGRRLAAEAVSGFTEHAHHLLSLEAALRFKKTVSEFISGSIVVGMCPEATLPVPVCEAALALAERFAHEIKNGDVSIYAVFPGTLEKAFEGSALFRNIGEEFRRKGIQLVQDFAITNIEENQIVSGSRSISHDLLMLMPPFESQLSLRNLATTTDIWGFAKVNTLMQVAELDRVYAAGDIVSLPGPKFAYMAMRQGKVAAVNIMAELSGQKPTTEYAHKIEWAISEKYTDPVFFHYGFWDETLDDFDENALFGMAQKVRHQYGPLKEHDEVQNSLAA